MRSLQARMLMLSGVAAVLVTLLFGWAIAAVLERLVVQGLDGRLDAQLALMAAAVDAGGHVDQARLDRDRGGLFAGPNWHWRITGPDGTLGSTADVPLSRVPAAQPLPPPSPSPPTDSVPPPGPGPDAANAPRPFDVVDAGGNAHHGRSLILQTERGPVQLQAEAPRAVLQQPIRAALMPLLSLLLVLLLLLGAAAWLQLRFGLAPVRRLRDGVELIRTGRGERVDENQPAELRPLAQELNALAADNRAALAAARRSGANLAHALKTPVAVLALEFRNEPERAAQLARIDDTIRHHLQRARIALADHRAETALLPAVEGVLRAITHLHAERGLEYRVDGIDHFSVGMDPHDLDELLGNLLDNAAVHASSAVSITAARSGSDSRLVEITVCDDGPGIQAAQRDSALMPGRRLDERVDGHGFGLAIAAELATLYGGRISLGDRPGGGLSVTLLLPGRS